jgi:3-oxoacyl-[acyl-carrier protein] reductase
MAEINLKGKVALITGASQGIGRAIALAYGKAGAKLALAARNQGKLNEVMQTAKASGCEAIALKTDVRLETEVKSMLERTVTSFGGLDIVVVNAGISSDYQTVEAGSSNDWLATFETNLFGAYYTIKASIPYLKQRGAGKIITVGSGLGHHGRAGGSAYAASKAALWMLTRVTAQELANENISVNELIPGPVETDILTNEDFRKNVVEKQREWLKTPEDVTQLALFLAAQPDFGPSAQSFSLMRRDR